MPTLEQLVELAQLGAIPMLTIAVWHLWNRHNALTDRFISYLEKRADEGDNSAQEVKAELNGTNKKTP